MPPAAIAANSEFVYILRGNILVQLDARTLRLVRRIKLEEERPPVPRRPKEQREQLREQPRKQPREQPKEQPREQPRERPREQPSER